jgi:molecular chaperone GrpE
MREFESDQEFQVNDRRRFSAEGEPVAADAAARDEAAPPAGVAAEGVTSEELQQWQERALAAEAKLRDFAQAFTTYRQEHDAIRMRIERDREQRIRESLARSFTRILEALDNLEAALEYAQGNPLAQGLQLSLKGIHEALGAEGLERLSLVGDEFNPQFAAAVAAVPVTNPELHNKVLAEMRAGYVIGGLVVRPAQVRVGRLTPDAPNAESESIAD